MDKIDNKPFEKQFLTILNADMTGNYTTPQRSLEDLLYEQDSVNHSCGNRGVYEAQKEWELNQKYGHHL